MSSNPQDSKEYLPRILIIDDQWGSVYPNGRRNSARFSFCQKMGLIDESPDSRRDPIPEAPIARVVFARGQTPVCATEGSVVENSIPETLKIVRSGWENCVPQDRWAAVFVDMEFLTGKVTKESQESNYPGKPEVSEDDSKQDKFFGLDLLVAIADEFQFLSWEGKNVSAIPLVVLSSKADVKEQIKRSSRYHNAGTIEFLSKDATKNELSEFIWKHGLVPDNSGKIIGYSLPLLIELKKARLFAANRDANILVFAETGSGKESFVRYLMRFSSRTGPQITQNSGELNENLGQSQLFGHVKGAFTDATADKIGLLQAADGGDMFLDEIARLPRTVQHKLLRVLEPETRTFKRLGDEVRELRSDVRFIAASNVDLRELASRNEFEHDFPDRFNVKLTLLPLRERFEDLPFLVDALLSRMGGGCSVLADEREAFFKQLRTYHWPSNIRELRNLLEQAKTLRGSNAQLTPRDIPLPNTKTVLALTTNSQSPALEAVLSARVEQPQFALTQLLDQMKGISFAHTNRDDLNYGWVKLRSVFARIAATMLEQCLHETTSANKPNLTEAYRVLTGDDVSDSNKNKPGDLLRDIRELDEPAIQDLLRGGTLLSRVNSEMVKKDRYRNRYEKAAKMNLGEAIMSALVSIESDRDPDRSVSDLLKQARTNSKVLDDYMRIWQGAECFPTGVVAVGFAGELVRAARGNDLRDFVAKVKELLGERDELTT